MRRPLNRWGLITQIVVTGVPLVALVGLFLTSDRQDQAGLGWVIIFAGMNLFLLGAAAGRIVSWLTRTS